MQSNVVHDTGELGSLALCRTRRQRINLAPQGAIESWMRLWALRSVFFSVKSVDPSRQGLCGVGLLLEDCSTASLDA